MQDFTSFFKKKSEKMKKNNLKKTEKASFPDFFKLKKK